MTHRYTLGEVLNAENGFWSYEILLNGERLCLGSMRATKRDVVAHAQRICDRVNAYYTAGSKIGKACLNVSRSATT